MNKQIVLLNNVNKFVLLNNVNKFVNNQYTYIDIQYMNAFIKGI